MSNNCLFGALVAKKKKKACTMGSKMSLSHLPCPCPILSPFLSPKSIETEILRLKDPRNITVFTSVNIFPNAGLG